MNVTNSIWVSISSLLMQGAEIYPRSMSCRVAVVVWWMCIVIFEATYTANLAAFLTTQRLVTPINSVQDLAMQTKISYGTVDQSAVVPYFAESSIEMFNQMHYYMTSTKTLVEDSDEGIELVRRNPNYAFLWDSAVLEYKINQEKPCNLRLIGRPFANNGYGFGLQKNSPFTNEVSSIILQLRQNGFMDDLREKWYKRGGECNSQTVKEEEKLQDSTGRYGVEDMLGVFYVIYLGLVLSIVILPLEWLVASIMEIDAGNPDRPNTFPDSVNDRWSRLSKDLGHALTPSICHKKRKFNQQTQRRLSTVRAMSNKEIQQVTMAINKVTGIMDMNGTAYKNEGISNNGFARRDSNLSEYGRITQTQNVSEKKDEITEKDMSIEDVVG